MIITNYLSEASKGLSPEEASDIILAYMRGKVQEQDAAKRAVALYEELRLDCHALTILEAVTRLISAERVEG